MQKYNTLSFLVKNMLEKRVLLLGKTVVLKLNILERNHI